MKRSSGPSGALQGVTHPKSLKALAFEAIKEAMLKGALEPSVLFSEPEMAKHLGMSRTPVREALQELSSLGFVEYLPRRGFRIREYDEKAVIELYDYRIILEIGIVRLVVPRIDSAAISELDSIHEEDTRAAEEHDMEGFIKVNRRFHAYLASLTENRHLMAAAASVRDLMEFASLNVKDRDKRPIEAAHEHEAIIDMLRKRDVEGAVLMMRNHLSITRELALRRRRPGM